MTKNKPIDLEEAIRNQKAKRYETTDAFTGEIVQTRSPNHYEWVDPTLKAPAVDLPRPTLRQRVENLLNRGGDPLAAYLHDGSSDTDYDVPDDPDAPLTASECNYIDMVAAEVAEQAPLPDDGMPRTPPSPSLKPQKPAVEGGEGEEGGSQEPPPPAAPPPTEKSRRK